MTPSDHIIYETRAWELLSRSFRNNRLSGTYLVYGPEGSGRWLYCLTAAALLNCESVETASHDPSVVAPCGHCRPCRLIFDVNFEGLHLALPVPPHENKLDKAYELMAEMLQVKREEPFALLTSSENTNIPIEFAREIKSKLATRAPKGLRRVVVFYQMEKMRTQSADALLKLIEEPPEDTVVFLVCRKPETLLPTIQSRARKLRLGENRPATIEQYLITRRQVSQEQARLLARVSGGSIGRALELLSGQVDNGASERAVMLMLYKSLFQEPSFETISLIEEMIDLRDRGKTEELLRIWQLVIRDCADYAVTADESRITNFDFGTEVKKLSHHFDHTPLAARLTEEIKNTLADLRRNVHIPGALTALTLKLKAHIMAAKAA